MIASVGSQPVLNGSGTQERGNLSRGFIDDIRYSLRVLARSYGVTVTAILTLSLGIGINTALFSVVNAVLINPLRYTNANELVAISSQTNNFPHGSISFLNFLDWQQRNRSFSAMAVFLTSTAELTGQGKPERIKVENVSSAFFPLLGVKPVIGRLFVSSEDQLGGDPVVLLSGEFWKTRFGNDRNVIGKTLTLDAGIYTVVGVIPSGFTFVNESFHPHADLFEPIGQIKDPSFRDRVSVVGARAVGRLKPGLSLSNAQADMSAVARQLATEYPFADDGVGVSLVTLKDAVVGDTRPYLLLLFVAGILVLLIGYTNVASLLLVLSTGLAGDFAIRMALGASRWRLIRLVMIQSLLLALSGAFLGTVFAGTGTHAALALLPMALPRGESIHIDGLVLLFTLGISLLAATLFGFASALKVSNSEIAEALKESGRGAIRSKYRAHRIFVVIETLLAVVLLIGAGLMIRSLLKLWKVDPGFDPHNVSTFTFTTPRPLGATPAEIRARLQQISQQIESAPGVTAASFCSESLPMGDTSDEGLWLVNESKPSSGWKMKTAVLYNIQPDYFSAMGVPLIRGRLFTLQDNSTAVTVAVVDKQFARLYFGDKDPLGKRINLVWLGTSPTIVGIVGNVKQHGLDEGAQSPSDAELYVPIAQMPDQLISNVSKGAAVVVRGKGNAKTEIAGIERVLLGSYGDVLIDGVDSMDHIVSDSLAPRQFLMTLLTVFAGLALLLACTGIYAVISYITLQRSREIGVRLALGAKKAHILRMVLRQGIFIAITGIGGGVLIALAMMWVMSRMLFGVSARDPFTIIAVSLLLLAVSIAATFVPAWRATRVDPVVSLRHQ